MLQVSSSKGKRLPDNPLKNSHPIRQYIGGISSLMVLKQDFSLSCACFFTLCLVADGYNTTSSLGRKMYGTDKPTTQVHKQLMILYGRGLLFKSGNKYYLTDKAMEAINRISL